MKKKAMGKLDVFHPSSFILPPFESGPIGRSGFAAGSPGSFAVTIAISLKCDRPTARPC
jgi:hypothetical protein